MLSIKKILIITRAWSFPLTFLSITLATILAWQNNHISIVLYLWCLATGLLWHAAANTLNDVFDLKNSIDTPTSPTATYRPHPIFSNLISENNLIKLSQALLVAAIASSGLLVIGKNISFYLKIFVL